MVLGPEVGSLTNRNKGKVSHKIEAFDTLLVIVKAEGKQSGLSWEYEDGSICRNGIAFFLMKSQ